MAFAGLPRHQSPAVYIGWNGKESASFVPHVSTRRSWVARADAVELEGLVERLAAQENEHMTISYPDGTALEALLLARGDDILRVIIPGDDDVRWFTWISGTWVSEDCVPVKIEFAWQRGGKTDLPREEDCICPKELASRLTSMLLASTANDDLIEDVFYEFSAEGRHVRIQQSQLDLLPS